MNLNVEELMASVPELLMTYGLKIFLAVVVFFVGKFIAKSISNVIFRLMTAKNVDLTVSAFAKNILYYVMVTVVAIAALGQLGIQTASFVAILGAAGLAVGFALQGSLSNFAAGVLLILFRPFKAGDFVEAGGTAGVVEEISIFSTILRSGDNKVIIVSNSNVMGGNITNYSAKMERRVDFTIGVSYSADLDKAKSILQEISEADKRILVDRGVTIGVSELADSSVNMVFRVWAKTSEYWPVYFDTLELVKKRFDQAGIEIPFPQMDVHVQNLAAA